MVEEPAAPPFPPPVPRAGARRAARADADAGRAAAEAVDGEEVLRFARALISAPSENPGGTEDLAAEVAGEILAGLDAGPETIRGEAGRPSVVASVGGAARPRLAWNGHLDVVPAGDPSSWDRPPFRGDLVDGRIVGRGAADMKGPIASAIGAVAAIRRAGVSLGGRLDLHLAADEELAGLHGTKVLRDAGRLDQDACIVGEPSELGLGLAQRGGAWITAVAHGRAAHGSTPHLGVNAITSMARLLLRLPEALPDREHPLVGRPTVNAAIVAGGSAPNVVPERCEVDIDRRIVPGERSPQEVLAPFERLAADLRREHPEVELEFRIREWTDAAESPGDSAIASSCRTAVRAETGAEPRERGFTGITDARFYINDAAIPTVILGPGSLEVAHTANEWVALADLVTAARVYARAFVGFLGGS
jgi:acetylornithine deacetylase/succinyl-diaminopimelate desuccinylase family protein